MFMVWITEKPEKDTNLGLHPICPFSIRSSSG